MTIGSMNGKMPHDVAAHLASEMAERVRGAHQKAELDPESAKADSAPEVRQRPREVNAVGSALRGELEDLVAEVINPGTSEPDDLVGEVVERVVADRVDRGQLEVSEERRLQVVNAMSRDPVVVAEIDDLLRDIAREMAFEGSR